MARRVGEPEKKRRDLLGIRLHRPHQRLRRHDHPSPCRQGRHHRAQTGGQGTAAGAILAGACLGRRILDEPTRPYRLRQPGGLPLLGRSREELLSLSIPDIDPLFPKEAWAAHWEELKARGSMSIETQHQTKQGEVFPVEVTTNYLEFDGKEYSFAFARDISERKRAE